MTTSPALQGGSAAEAGADDHVGHDVPGRMFWPGVALGWVVAAVGIWGLLSDAERTRPRESVRFVVGAALVHDLVLAPVVVLAGWVLAKAVPPRIRGPVQAALVVSAMVALFSVPFVRGYGRAVTNPSILPRNYGAGLAVTLGAVWAAAAAAVALRCWRARGGASERASSRSAVG